MPLVWGRECELGWGYNKDWNQLIPVEEQSLGVQQLYDNKWRYNVYDLSSMGIQCLVRFLYIY